MQPPDDRVLLAFFKVIASRDHLEVSRMVDRRRRQFATIRIAASRQEADTYFLDSIRHYVYAGDTTLHISAAAYNDRRPSC